MTELTGIVSSGRPVAPSLAQAQAMIDRVASGERVAQVCEIRHGEIGAVYAIELMGDVPSLVLKLYPETLHWKMQKEVNVCALLSDRLSVSVPRILLADDSKSLIGLNFLIMRRLEGEILRELEAALGEEQLFACYLRMGQVLREIHHITLSNFGYIGPHGVRRPHPSNRAYVSQQFDRHLADFLRRGGDGALAERVRAVVRERAMLFEACSAACLCHFDFHSGNVLAERRQGSPCISGILDFEGAIAGDPLLDIAKALYCFTSKDETKKAGLLAGYGAMERRDWQEALVLYRLLCTLELWCWMAQIGNHAPLAALAEDLRETVRRWR